MAKITLTDLASAQAASIISTINANNALIETAIENTYSRDGTGPNTLEDSLDANSNRILNLPVPISGTEPIRKTEFDAEIDAIDAAVSAAQSAQTAAEAALDTFTDLWLGSFGSDPTVDNDGNPLQEGALYYNSGSGLIKIYVNSAWSIPLSGGIIDSAEIDAVDLSGNISLSLIAGSIDETKLDASTNASLDKADSASQPGHTHTLADVTNVTITAANLNILDDAGDTALHFHSADRARAVHTGTQLASTVSDFNEAAQDAVGGMVDSTLVYSDATPSLIRAALTGAVTASAGSNTTALGSFTMAQLDSAVSDGNVSYTTHDHAGVYQPLDADLTTWAGLTPSANAQSLVTAANYAAMRGLLDLEAGTDFYSIAAANAAFQPIDTDLTTIAGLTATSDNFLQAKSSAWASRTPTQVTADLINFVGDSGSGGSKGLVPAPVAGDASKFLRGDGTFVAIPGGGDALVANPLSQFAATTSLQLKGVISDETGSGALVFATDPTITLVNATGLPVAGITASTTQALGVGSIELGHASDTTIARASAGNITVEGNTIYRAGGTDVALADGGTGASLTDPNADRIMFWDDSAGAVTWLTAGTNLSITGTTLSATGGGTIDVQTFNADGTWTKPGSGTIALVQAWGAGGSGGKGSANAAAGGGGGGAFVERWFLLSDLGATETVTVGTGGPSQTTALTAGTVGENTTFGSLLTAYGGGGGYGAQFAGNNGGGGGGTPIGAGATPTAGTVGGLSGSGVASITGATTPSLGSYGGQGATTGQHGGISSGWDGGGGGGSSSTATDTNGNGGHSVNGGGGGGGGAEDSAPGAGIGGTSILGGNGGAGAFDANNATAGTQPGGGGGGSETGNSGAGGDGRVIVRVM